MANGDGRRHTIGHATAYASVMEALAGAEPPLRAVAAAIALELSGSPTTAATGLAATAFYRVDANPRRLST